MINIVNLLNQISNILFIQLNEIQTINKRTV